MFKKFIFLLFFLFLTSNVFCQRINPIIQPIEQELLNGYIVSSYAASLMTATNSADIRNKIGAYGNGDSPTFDIITGKGTNITDLNASNLTSGTISDSRVSSNIMKLSESQTVIGNNTFSGTNTFSNLITGNINMGGNTLILGRQVEPYNGTQMYSTGWNGTYGYWVFSGDIYQEAGRIISTHELRIGADSVKIVSGSGSPEGVVTAGNVAAFYINASATSTASIFYIRPAGLGTGNTGWVAK